LAKIRPDLLSPSVKRCIFKTMIISNYFFIWFQDETGIPLDHEREPNGCNGNWKKKFKDPFPWQLLIL
jgi:hypothetical protein